MVSCGFGFQDSYGQEDYYGYKKIRDSSNGLSLKEREKGETNENIFVSKGFF
jgi:hypothetical protein